MPARIRRLLTTTPAPAAQATSISIPAASATRNAAIKMIRFPGVVRGPGFPPADSQVQADPALATYGTLPRNFFRGPGYVNFDLAFSKTTDITERVKFEFRAEFFNLFNHTNFANPGIINNGNGTFAGGAGGNDPNSSLFGQITSTYDPRIIQL